MINKLRSFWQNILSIGLKPDTDFEDFRRIRILNGLAFITTVFTFFNAFWGLIIELPGLILLNYAVSIVMILVLYSNKRGYFRIAKFLFFTVIGIHIATIELALNVGAHFYLFPLFILAAFIMKKKSSLGLYIIFLLIIFAASEAHLFPQFTILIDDELTIIVKIIDGCAAFGFSIFGINLFIGQYKASRDEIVIKNQLQEETLQISNERAEYANLLLKEMNHRVKNNLQLISSLLNIHAAQLEDKAAKEAVLNAKRRISSIALIHRQLYKEDQSSSIDIAEYIDDLIPFIIESLIPAKKNVNFQHKAQRFNLSIEDAVSIGLIINELLTNSIRHGIKNQKTKEILLEVKKTADSTIQIMVKDSGTGIKKMDNNSNSGFGFELIKMLASNYDGKVMIDDAENKITIVLHYKLYDLSSINIKLSNR